MNRFFVITTAMILSFLALAQDDDTRVIYSSPVDISLQSSAMMVEPFEFTIINPDDLVVEFARDLTIPYNVDVARVALTLSSRATGAIRIETSHPDMMISDRFPNPYRVYSGESSSINFVVFSPHEGTIWIYNAQNELIAEIPYNVTKLSAYRNRVNAGYDLGGNINVSYSLANIEHNVSFGANARYNHNTQDFSGGVNISVSW